MHRRIIPLVNFESEVSHADFLNGYVLEPLTEEELRLIFEEPIRHSFRTSRWELIRHKLTTEISPQPKDSQDGQLVSSQPAIEIIHAMRLCHPGDICGPIFVDYSSSSTRWVSGGVMPVMYLGSPYQFKEQDVHLVVDQISLLTTSRCRADNRLTGTLGRFNDIYGRNRLEDRIVDCFIALESCLTPETTGEIGFRLALRSAAILSPTEKPEVIRSLIAAGYDARSKIVHGGLSMKQLFDNRDFGKKLRSLKRIQGLNPDADCITLVSFTGDLIECLRGVLRTVIREMNRLNMDTEELVAELDDNIASALRMVRKK
jgi:hypothetical protein